MTYLKLDFRGYDNPDRAADVWYDYLPDLERLDLLTTAEGIIYDDNKRANLELRLDALVSEAEMIFYKRNR